ncbi:MAG TPA: hypothetical protein VNQ73_04955 [Ilumatobacter sp.]|nr:hypothetical protein [Ilumatobacter sp.]
MHPHHAFDPTDHYRNVIAEARRDRLALALRRQARARRMRRRADELDDHARRALERTFT